MRILSPIAVPYRISQGYGENPPFYIKYGLKRGHNGLDMVVRQMHWRLNHAFPILAPASGELFYCESPGYGRYAYLYTDKGNFVLAHLALNEGVDRYARAGEIIGYMGYSGNCVPIGVPGTHLHLGWRPVGYDLEDGMRGYADPLPLLEAA